MGVFTNWSAATNGRGRGRREKGRNSTDGGALFVSLSTLPVLPSIDSALASPKDRLFLSPRSDIASWAEGGRLMNSLRLLLLLAALLIGRTSEAVGSRNTTTDGVLVGITLIESATAKGAVCLDGTPPAYHLHRGYGSGANSWLIQLEGGGWCNNGRTCVFRKTTHRGSSRYMETSLPFTGILSNKAEENPDFYNWNRVKVRYCDGASFSGEGYDPVHGLFFRGQRIWSAVMEELQAKGMRFADRALLSGCSAGGLSTILHCDEFRALFPSRTVAKCLADAGMFLDVADVAGAHALRSMFEGVVNLQGVAKNLPRSCTSRMDPTSCFFPQNLINHIQTPIFLLNSAYDLWQIMESVAPPTSDPAGLWISCKRSHATCSSQQLSVLQGFRNQMVNAVKAFSTGGQNGLFINSCFVHCQSEEQGTWFSYGSPALRNKRIAESVGDWFFQRGGFKAIDCPYPCDGSCRHQN